MATLTISLPDDTLKFLEQKAREGGHASVDAYVGAVLHAIRLDEAKRKFEAKIQEAIDSGPAVPLTPEFWVDLEREIFEQLEAEKAKSRPKARTGQKAKAGRRTR
jgi:Arc/MetJ-type ribon-helix-helix transcriptional regulator